MLLRQFNVDVTPIDDPDTDEVLRAEAWVYDHDNFDNTLEDIAALAAEFGYQIAGDGSIYACNAIIDSDPSYTEDHFIIEEY